MVSFQLHNGENDAVPIYSNKDTNRVKNKSNLDLKFPLETVSHNFLLYLSKKYSPIL